MRQVLALVQALFVCVTSAAYSQPSNFDCVVEDFEAAVTISWTASATGEVLVYANSRRDGQKARLLLMYDLFPRPRPTPNAGHDHREEQEGQGQVRSWPKRSTEALLNTHPASARMDAVARCDG